MAKGENPAKRSARYARELKSGKNELTGKKLTKGQRGFRGGVLNERKWGAEIHKHKEATKPKRKSTNKSKAATRKNNVSTFHPRVYDFDYDEYGNIKGHCIGGNLNKFEPD